MLREDAKVHGIGDLAGSVGDDICSAAIPRKAILALGVADETKFCVP